MAIFPVEIPYSLQKPKNPYRRNFSVQVAKLSLRPRRCQKNLNQAVEAIFSNFSC